MNAKHLTCLIVLLLCFSLATFGQDQIRIMDSDGESVGRFKTQLYHLSNSELIKIRGNSPTVDGSGDQIELVLRLMDLRWFDKSMETEPVKIERGDIAPSDPRAVQVSSSPSSYTLDSEGNLEADIKFRVLRNGQFSLKVPFEAGKIKGQYVQMFEIEGLSSNTSDQTPIGAIADLKKEWREVDKRDLEAVQGFIDKYANNEIAIEERLIAVAERTKLRIEKSEIQNEEDAELAWLELGESTDVDAIRAFLDEFPDSKYAEAAKARLGEDANVLIKAGNEVRNLNNTLVKTDNNIYKLDLSHLSKVEIKLSHPDDIEIFDNGGNKYNLEIKGSKKYKITVVETGTGDKFEFDLDNRFKAEMEEQASDFVFKVNGGVSPYTVEFYKDGEDNSLLEGRFEGLETNRVGEVIVTSQMLKTSGMNGNYRKVTIRDFTTQAVSSFPIDINVAPQRISSKLIIGILGGALIIGGAFMFFYNKRQKETRKAYREKAKVFQQTQKFQQAEIAASEMSVPLAGKVKKPKADASEKSTGARKITITKPTKKFVPANGGNSFVSSGRMKITKRDVKGGRLTSDEFKKVLSDGKYAFLDLTELWPDTAIKELYVSNECIKELGKFLKEENLDKVVAEMEGAIPEVGGFLMGYHQLNEEGFIRVTMDEFVPFVPEYHDVFKIEIGTATLVQELGDAQDTHPDKDVIGWFHTHPGHGLFLSNSDLSVQRHFPLKYQIAMEIDSLTNTLDTAFFTRKVDGTINNVEHRKKGANWFSWKKIENI
jgi:proteasome lid subunit RPN8/RPN11/gas vesicle protein